MNPEEQKKPVVVHSGGADAVYGIGMIGAWVYYLQRATTNQERALGLAKGLVWPAFLVYALLEFLEKE
jgi:phage gp29-like protein